MAENNSKPAVIILGGSGFIGRNLVQYLIENDLVSAIRVVDKVPSQTAWFSAKHQEIFNDPRIEFKSANLIIPASCESAFINNKAPFEYCFNCAGETKCAQTDAVYREGIYKLSLNCASIAAKHKISRYVEVSSGHFVASEKNPLKENDKLEPWTFVAKYKLQVEQELTKMEGLQYTIVRPAIVYGPGDKHGLTPRLVIASVYKHLGEMMRLLWSGDLHTDTIHVQDVARALWHVAHNPQCRNQIYNLVDQSCSTQGSVTGIISEIFNINHDFWGNKLSSLCKADMSSVVEEINDKHMGPWAEACRDSNVLNTPLSPYIDKELLANKHLYLDGSKLQTTGFTLHYPTLTKQNLHEVINEYVEMELFPRRLVT